MTGTVRRSTGARIRGGLVPILLTVALALGACSSGADSESATTRAGGAAALPGPAPSGLAFKPAPTDAPAAPRATGTLTDGTRVDLAELWADRSVVLVFFNSWCTLCAERQTAISDLARTHQDRVVFVGVASVDEPDELDAYLREHRVEYPVIFDPEQTIWRAYAVREPPTVVLVAKGGTLLRGWPGGLDASAIQERLDELVLG
jgi:peroxiredoxin